MAGFATVTIHCPFPPCDGQWWVKDDGQGHRVTSHLPQGRAAEPWEGTEAESEDCPGSHLLLLDVAYGGGHLGVGDQAKIDRAMRQWQLASQIKKHLPEVEQARRNRDELPKHPFIGFPVGNPIRSPYTPSADAFPGRPADAPEPGPGDKPDKILPMNQIGQSLGRAAMEDARSTHAALVNLTLNKIDETQGALANLTSMLHLVDGKVSEVAVHMATSMALCTAAIGSGHGINDAGREMASNLALAAAGETPDGTLRQYLAALQAATAATYTLLAQAVDRGRAYADTI